MNMLFGGDMLRRTIWALGMVFGVLGAANLARAQQPTFDAPDFEKMMRAPAKRATGEAGKAYKPDKWPARHAQDKRDLRSGSPYPQKRSDEASDKPFIETGSNATQHQYRVNSVPASRAPQANPGRSWRDGGRL